MEWEIVLFQLTDLEKLFIISDGHIRSKISSKEKKKLLAQGFLCEMKHLCSPATLDLSKEVQNETSKDTFSQDFEMTLEVSE